MHSTLQACQPCVLPFAKDAIIAVGDYGFVNEIWPQIEPNWHQTSFSDSTDYSRVEADS